MTTVPSYLTQCRFGHALAIVRAIPQTSTLQPVAADKLQFYGLYKQATEGDVNIPRPSSRQVVDYAKWKAWSRMKGISPIDAQNLYVESLIHLLTELVHRYPHHEQAPFLKTALHNLERQDEEEDFFQDASDIAEFELQENFLNHIDADQLRRQDIYSPPSTPASAQTKAAYNQRHHSISTTSHTEYPITPITSPGQNAVTGQWVLNQLQEHNKVYVHPMDFLQPQDGLSEADTIDREVAAATANLVLSSPRQSPYQSKKKHSHSSSTVSSKKKDSHRALERLQTEVSALTEQIDRLRRQNHKKDGWTLWKVVMVLIKHLMADSAIFMIAFYILWKRRSPLANSLMNYIMPILQDIVRNIIRKVVFWKITV